MEQKTITKMVYNPDLCAECTSCPAISASFESEDNNLTFSESSHIKRDIGEVTVAKPGIRFVKYEGPAITRFFEEERLLFQPAICQQCDRPPCPNACPVRVFCIGDE